MTPERIGRYEVQRRLGTGGMGSLYLARDPSLDRLVAIKLLKDDYQDDAELRERFLREARSVARLRHRNIVLVFDVGEDDGRQFMAMEYLAGQTLTKLLARTPPVSLARRLMLAEQLCAGLAHAHAAGIVHRDIKPANIMLDAEGVLKILDFGIAHLADSGMTRDGMMMGSVNYMAPEQVVGQRIDHRTDIFAAGAVLYEMVSLTQAFPGGFDSGALNRILNQGHTPLPQVVPGVDSELAAIVDRALERTPEKRYQDAAAMRRDLLHVRRRLPEDEDEGEHSRDETVVVRPRPSTPPSGRGRREDTGRKDTGSARFGVIRREQAEEHLRLSRQALERGDHAAALEAAERAAAIDPDYQEAFDLMDRTKAALEALAIAQSLDKADLLLSEGRLTEAESLIARGLEATTLDTPAARDLQARARKIADQIATVRDRFRRIQAGVARARTSLDGGQYDTALRAISELLTLDPGNVEARELQEKATKALAAQREHELRRKQAYDRVDFARSLAGSHRHQEAADTLAAIMPPSDTVRQAVADAVAFLDEQRRLAARQALLTSIREQIEANAFEQALAAIDAVPPDERTGELRALRSKAENGLRAREQLQRTRIELNRVMTTARDLCGAGDFDGAREAVAEGFRLGGDEQALTQISEEIARAESAAEQTRLQSVRDRMATRKVEAARQIATRDIREAVVFLENDDSGHSAIAAALQKLRDEAVRQDQAARERAERERAQQAEAERRAREESERREREKQEQEKHEREKQERENRARLAAEAEARRREESDRREREQQEREQQEREKQERENRARLAAEAAEARRREEFERVEREKQEREHQARLAAEAEARRQDAREREREEAASETLVLPAPAKAREAVESARPSPEPTVVVQPPRPPAAAASRTLNVKLLGGLAAVIVVGVIGAVFLRGRFSEAPQAPIDTPNPAPIAATPTTVPVTPPPEPPQPGGPSEIDRVVQSARSLLQAGNLSGAARAVNGGLARAPQDAGLQALVLELFRAASAQAQQAKTAADQAKAASQPGYQEAVTRLKSADAQRAARRIEPAIDEYATAARLFNEAARAPQVAQLPTVVTTIPAAEPSPRVTTAPSTVASTIAPTSVAPTTSILPGIDADTVQRVLAAYGSASRTFNVAAIEQIYPGLPAISRQRLDALRKNYSFCDYTYSNVRIVSATPTDATIRADSLESCKPKTAQRAMDTRVTQQLTLRKAASGAWTITEILGQ